MAESVSGSGKVLNDKITVNTHHSKSESIRDSSYSMTVKGGKLLAPI